MPCVQRQTLSGPSELQELWGWSMLAAYCNRPPNLCRYDELCKPMGCCSRLEDWNMLIWLAPQRILGSWTRCCSIRDLAIHTSRNVWPLESGWHGWIAGTHPYGHCCHVQKAWVLWPIFQHLCSFPSTNLDIEFIFIFWFLLLVFTIVPKNHERNQHRPTISECPSSVSRSKVESTFQAGAQCGQSWRQARLPGTWVKIQSVPCENSSLVDHFASPAVCRQSHGWYYTFFQLSYFFFVPSLDLLDKFHNN